MTANFAEVITENFNAGLPANATLFGNALAQNQRIELTQDNVVGQLSGLAFDELDVGLAVQAFDASFDFQAGDNTINGGADGFSFSFTTLGNVGAFGENGSPTGIAISYDTFNNGNNGEISDNHVSLRVDNILIAENDVTAILDLNDNQVHSTRVELLDTGDISVFITPNSGAESLVLSATIADFTPFRGQFNFGARTGGNSDLHAIDNFNATTTAVPEPSTYVLLFLISGFFVWRNRSK